MPDQGGHLRAGAGQGVDQFAVGVLEMAGVGAQQALEAFGGDGTPVGLDASLVDVADQEVGTAGVAKFPDLPQKVGDGDCRLLGAACAQVVAVGVDQGGPVLRGLDQAVRLGDAGVAPSLAN
jgi:hypothetical protein